MSDNAEKRLHSFRFLENGWDRGSGGPLGESIIDAGLQIAHLATSVGFKVSDAFAGGDGSAEVYLRSGNTAHHFTLMQDDAEAEVLITYGKKPANRWVEDDYFIDLSTALFIVKKISPCRSTASSASPIGTKTRASSRVVHFRTPATVQESRWSVLNVPKAMTETVARESVLA